MSSDEKKRLQVITGADGIAIDPQVTYVVQDGEIPFILLLILVFSDM